MDSATKADSPSEPESEGGDVERPAARARSPRSPARKSERPARRPTEPSTDTADVSTDAPTEEARPRRRRRRRREEPDDDGERDRPRHGAGQDAGGEPSDESSLESLMPSAPGYPEPEVHTAEVRTEDIDDDALKVIRRLRRYGHRAYLVGGGVRDLLLRAKPKDFDIATSARPNEVRALFRNCRIIGRRFRLAHVLFGGGKIIEVATFRRDPTEAFDVVEGEFQEEMEAQALESSETPTDRKRAVAQRRDDVDLLIRHDNVFGEPHEDALRRDFTINGLFYDTEAGAVIDYVGGMSDVRHRVVRTIGPPDVRFREDPVRILRAIKFSARLDLGIDSEVYDAMVAQRDELARAARPRLLEEILRLLRGGASHRSFWLMWETGVLGVLIPQLAVHLDDDSPAARLLWKRLDAIDAMRRSDSLPPDAVLFAAMMHGPILEAMAGQRDTMGAYESLMNDVVEHLAVPRRMKERVRNIVHAQRRMRSGKLGALPRREYFDDAANLLAIDCDSRGEVRPEWLDRRPKVDPAQQQFDDLPPRRRRRGRR